MGKMNNFAGFALALVSLIGSFETVKAQSEEEPSTMEEASTDRPGEESSPDDTTSDTGSDDVQDPRQADPGTGQPEESDLGETQLSPPDEEELSAAPAIAETDEEIQTKLADKQQDFERKTTVREPTSPIEDPDTSYWFLGAGYEHYLFPSFLSEPFTDVSYSMAAPAAIVSLNYRKNNFDLFLNFRYFRLSGEGAFLGKGEPIDAVEFINFDGHALTLEAKVAWSIILNEYVSLQAGLGFAAGYLIDNTSRTEAYPDPNGGYSPCYEVSAPNDPVYCEPGGSNNSTEGADWFGGGALPPSFWAQLSLPEIGVRIKPIHQVMVRLYGGFAIWQGFYGGATVYFGF